MDEVSARDKAQTYQSQGGVPVDYQIKFVEKALIEITEQTVERISPVRDCLVWLIRFVKEISWIEIALDDVTHEVVRIRRSH